MGSASSYVLTDFDLRNIGRQANQLGRFQNIGKVTKESQVGRSVADVSNGYAKVRLAGIGEENENETEYECEESKTDWEGLTQIKQSSQEPVVVAADNLPSTSGAYSRRISPSDVKGSEPTKKLQPFNDLEKPDSKNANEPSTSNTNSSQQKRPITLNAKFKPSARAKNTVTPNRNLPKSNKENSAQAKKVQVNSKTRGKKVSDKPETHLSKSTEELGASVGDSAPISKSEETSSINLDGSGTISKGIVEIAAKFKVSEESEFVEMKYKYNTETQEAQLISDSSMESLMQFDIEMDKNGNPDAKQFFRMLPKLMNRFEGMVWGNGYKISWDKKQAQRMKVIGFDINVNPIVMTVNPKEMKGVSISRSSTRFEVRGQSEFGPEDSQWIRIEGDKASELKIVPSDGKLILCWPSTAVDIDDC